MLRLLAIALPAAILIGYAAGGRLSNLADTRLRWMVLGLAGVALQFVPATGSLGNVLLFCSFVLLFVVVGVNWRLPGFVLILVGLWMNFLVITVDEGMPVTKHALIASGQADTVSELKRLDSPKHHFANRSDELLIFGDLIGIPPPIRQAVSMGDLAVFAGVMWFAIGAMRRKPEPAPAEESEAPADDVLPALAPIPATAAREPVEAAGGP
jgi:hypothetical protein